MPKSLTASVAVVVLGTAAAISLLPIGNRYGPGWGDVLNGTAGLLLLPAGAIRNRRRLP